MKCRAIIIDKPCPNDATKGSFLCKACLGQGKKKRGKKHEDGAILLDAQLKALGCPYPWVREFLPNPNRKWRNDLAWPELMLVVEVDGGTEWGKSRHSRGEGLEKQHEKENWEALAGYCVLKFTTKRLKNGSAAAELMRVLPERAFEMEEMKKT